MAGMIEKQMGQATPPGQPAPADEQMPAEPGGMAEEGGESEQYSAAIEYAMQALYKNGGAKQLAQALRSADDPAQAMADAAYQILQIIDEQTDGSLPDEELAPLAVDVLTEVAEVAEAAGVQVDGQAVAGAMRQMLLRFVQENGGDTSQLEQAMSQVDMSQFDQIGQEG